MLKLICRHPRFLQFLTWFVCLPFLFVLPVEGQTPISVDDMVNAKRDALIVKARRNIEQQSGTRQGETPAASSNSTSLLDRSSASDLLGLALNLSGLAGNLSDRANDDSNSDSISVTTTGYAFYALSQGKSPLDPEVYCDETSQEFRKLGITLGFDNQEGMEPMGSSDDAIIVGLKYLVVNERDACNVKKLGTIVTLVGGAASRATDEIQEFLLGKFIPGYVKMKEEIGDTDKEKLKAEKQTLETQIKELNQAINTIPKPQNLKTLEFELASKELRVSENKKIFQKLEDQKKIRFIFLTSIDTPDGFQKMYSKLTPTDLNEIDNIISKMENLGPFIKLDQAIAKEVNDILTAPQISIAATTKQAASGGRDEYTGSVIFDIGVGGGQVGLTGNLGFNYQDVPSGKDIYGGMLAAQAEYSFGKRVETRQDLLETKRIPVKVSAAVKGNWLVNAKPILKGQLKLTIPLSQGIELPISLSVANRTDLIDESEVRGIVGFSIDTSRLIDSATSLIPGL